MKNLILILCFTYGILPSHAENLATTSFENKSIQILLRELGNEVLNYHNDSTSLVLPIEQISETSFKVAFENDIDYNPSKVVDASKKILKHSDFANIYIVEVKDCNENKVVHSFSIYNEGEEEPIACLSRKYEPGCYTMEVSLAAEEPTYSELFPLQTTGQITSINKKGETWYLWLIAPVLLFSIGFIMKKKDGAIEEEEVSQEIGNYQFDHQLGYLLFQDQKIDLTSKENDLLMVLFHSINKTVPKETLLQKVWGDEGDYVGRTLDVYISKLRKKLEEDPMVSIENVRGVGYKLVVSSI